MPKTQIIAHRGASSYAPENTFAAFDLALDAKLSSFVDAKPSGFSDLPSPDTSGPRSPAFETDIQACADGHLVIIHDELVDRTTDGQGKVADYTLAQLKALDAGVRWDTGSVGDDVGRFVDWAKLASGFRGKYAGERIPTLVEFLDRYGGKLPIALELKGPGVEAETLAEVERRDILDSIVFTSFDLEYVRKIRRLSPRAKTGYLARSFSREDVERTLEAQLNQICPPAKDLTLERVRVAHELGLEVRAWGVSNDVLLARAIALDIEGLTTNWPDRGLRFVMMAKMMAPGGLE